MVGVLIAERGEESTRLIRAQWPFVQDVDAVIDAAQTLRRATGDKWPRSPYHRYDPEGNLYASH